MGNKLIVLGNGFDLASGLKSSYYDFFSERINDELAGYLDYAYENFAQNMYGINVKYDLLFNINSLDLYPVGLGYADRYSIGIPAEITYYGKRYLIYEKLSCSNLTFWDLIFYFSKFENNIKDFKYYDWQDVERRMLEFLQTPEKMKEIPSFASIEGIVNGSFRRKNVATLLCLHLACYLPKRDKQYSKENLIDYLYDELRLFEKYFANYIRTESNKDSYKHNAVNKICKISGKSIDSFDDKIFSFNYTDPFSEKKLDIINVHGKAKTNSILFGIDQEAILPDSEIYSFTKTFRQMTETKLAKNYQVDILPSKDEIEEIAFFGHSLSDLDYSYFQTIFDHYDVYNSRVRLVFYYEIYGDKTNRDMELDLANKISQMLHAYSPSIDNEKKGRNLLHKLLLEKRLIIEEIN